MQEIINMSEAKQPNKQGEYTVSSPKRMAPGGYLLSGLLAFFAVIQVYPLIWLVLFSLKSNEEIFSEHALGLPKQFRWQNYRAAFFDAKIGLYFFNSVLVTTVTIILVCVLGIMTSYAIARMQWKLQKITLIVFLSGLMIPVQAVLLPLMIVFGKLKLINTYLALIIPYTAFALPKAILIFVGFLHTIPKDLEEAALIDGGNIYQMIVSIIFPLMKPALATVSIFIYLASWNELLFALVFITKQQYRTLTVGIQTLVGVYMTDWGPIGAGMVVATLPTILIYLLMSSQVQKSLMTGAIKG
jgi:raffinose/stachyose/melibiose transport system permease protein